MNIKNISSKKHIIISLSLIILLLITIIYLYTQKNINKTNSNIDIYEEINNGSNLGYSYSNPVIPQGFKKVETDTASWELDEQGNPKGWNDGLVIEDELGNQFVWVPCTIDGRKQTVKYGRYMLNDGIYTLVTNRFQTDDPTSQWIFYEEDSINQDILPSIEKYQGFYIARYESGIENGILESKENTSNLDIYSGWNNGNLVIKRNCNVWNYITIDKAKEISNNFYNNGIVKSYLMTSYCFDTAIKWINNSIPDFIINSKNYGNYILPWNNYVESKESDFITFKTGLNDDYRVKNIYDLAGNALELTTEFSKTKNEDTLYSVIRDRFESSLITRTPIAKKNIGPLFGFRIVLILK